MAAYLLNLIFGRPSAASSATGLFNDFDDFAPFNARSKAWYRVPAGWPSPGSIQPNNQVTQTANLPVTTAPIPDKPRPTYPVDFSVGFGADIYLRVVPDGSWNPMPNNLNVLLAAFGRPNANHHDGDSVASPFVLSGGVGQGQNTPCSFFTLMTPPNGLIAPLSDNSWIFYLGTTAQNAPGGGASNCPNGKCVYSFLIAASFWQETNLYTYSHNPEMVVWVP